MVKSDNRPGNYVSAQQQRIQQQQQQQQGRSNNHQDTSAAVDAATKAAAAVHPESFVVAAAPEGVPDPFAPPPPGVSSNVAPNLRSDDANNWPPADPSQPHRLDSAGTIVAKQPVASAGQQSVLGSRKALRGVTAQQLLVEPVIQSLLSKV
jgi:hypothetical protein